MRSFASVRPAGTTRSRCALAISLALWCMSCGAASPSVIALNEGLSVSPPVREPSIADVAARARGAVVTIKTATTLGSGFHVGQGRIVSNFHVLAGCASATARTASGVVLPVTGVLAYDREKDLVVVTVDDVSMSELGGEQRAVRPGDTVVALGSPEGLDLTVTTGVVSAIRNDADRRRRVIQHTAPVSHGSSGGPLVGPRGELIGVNTFTIDGEGAQNLNFAVSIDEVLSLLGSDRKPISLEAFSQTTAPSGNVTTLAVPEAATLDLCKSGDRNACLCLGGQGDACGEVAKQTKVSALATGLFRKACELGSGAGCVRYGLSLSDGSGGKPDVGAARLMFERACELADAEGCRLRAVESTPEAGAFASKACQLGSAGGCALLADMFDKGRAGVHEDTAVAARLHSSVCASEAGSEHGSCLRLGEMYAAGRGVSRDLVFARRLLELLCHSGKSLAACERLRLLPVAAEAR